MQTLALPGFATRTSGKKPATEPFQRRRAKGWDGEKADNTDATFGEAEEVGKEYCWG